MKRIIKFRAWDKQNNCWYVPVHEAYKGNLFELLVGFGGDLSAHMMQGLVHESLWPDRFDLMQFTGLTDKNGKDVFEGDLVRTPQNIIGAVKYENQGAAFHVNWKDKDVSRYMPISATFSDGETWQCDFIEVIGNVFELPELLNS